MKVFEVLFQMNFKQKTKNQLWESRQFFLVISSEYEQTFCKASYTIFT